MDSISTIIHHLQVARADTRSAEAYQKLGHTNHVRDHHYLRARELATASRLLKHLTDNPLRKD